MSWKVYGAAVERRRRCSSPYRPVVTWTLGAACLSGYGMSGGYEPSRQNGKVAVVKSAPQNAGIVATPPFHSMRAPAFGMKRSPPKRAVLLFDVQSAKERSHVVSPPA